MLTSSLRRASRAVALCLILVACDENGTTVVLPARLRPGIWYMNTANGDDLPAKIGSRTVGIALEETFIDSASLNVVTGGTYEQKIFLRVMLNGAVDREELFFDRGSWAVASVGYTFVSSVRSRSVAATMPFASLLSTTEQVLSWTAAPAVEGGYRTTRP